MHLHRKLECYAGDQRYDSRNKAKEKFIRRLCTKADEVIHEVERNSDCVNSSSALLDGQHLHEQRAPPADGRRGDGGRQQAWQGVAAAGIGATETGQRDLLRTLQAVRLIDGNFSI